jgi:hypothetical protein
MTELLERKGERRERDNYPTPRHIARFVVDRAVTLHHVFTPPRPLDFYEPGCGDTAPFATEAAALGKNAFWGVSASDVRDVLPDGIDVKYEDFLKRTDVEKKYHETFDIIATNPPFVHGLDFWERSTELLAPGGVLAFVVKTSFLATKARSERFVDWPPAEVHILYPRPSFTSDSRTDIAQEYCAVFWLDKHNTRAWKNFGNKATSMKWLNHKQLIGGTK